MAYFNGDDDGYAALDHGDSKFCLALANTLDDDEALMMKSMYS